MVSKMKFSILLLVLFLNLTYGKKCHETLKPLGNSTNNDVSVVEYSCPNKNYPESYSECCGISSCCRPMLLEGRSMRFLSLSVIICCILLTLLLLLCCFWSPCPLYGACRPKYETSDIVYYATAQDVDPLCSMPVEGRNGIYKPVQMKSRRAEIV